MQIMAETITPYVTYLATFRSLSNVKAVFLRLVSIYVKIYERIPAAMLITINAIIPHDKTSSIVSRVDFFVLGRESKT